MHQRPQSTEKKSWLSPNILKTEFIKREDYEPSVQTILDSMNTYLTIKNYTHIPKIHYRCSGCSSTKPHNQQVLEWGVYEWVRKNPNNSGQAWTNLGINNPDMVIDKFLVGNQFLFRNSFVIISIFRFKKGI